MRCDSQHVQVLMGQKEWPGERGDASSDQYVMFLVMKASEIDTNGSSNVRAKRNSRQRRNRRGCIAETGREKDKGRRLIDENANRKHDREKDDINIKLKLTKSGFFTFIR